MFKSASDHETIVTQILTKRLIALQEPIWQYLLMNFRLKIKFYLTNTIKMLVFRMYGFLCSEFGTLPAEWNALKLYYFKTLGTTIFSSWQLFAVYIRLENY